MLRIARLLLPTTVIILLAACGTVATPAPTLVPTLSLPTRIPVVPTQGAGQPAAPPSVAVVVSAAPTQVPPTAPPTRAAPTLIPTVTPIPTKGPPTPTAVPPTAAPPKIDPAAATRGEALFKAGTGDLAVPACATCHYVDKDEIFVGPSLKGIAARAGQQVPGQDAATYLHNSIVKPNEHLVPNQDPHIFAVNGTSLMYQNYAQHLSDAQVGDLVSYLLTLK